MEEVVLFQSSSVKPWAAIFQLSIKMLTISQLSVPLNNLFLPRNNKDLWRVLILFSFETSRTLRSKFRRPYVRYRHNYMYQARRMHKTYIMKNCHWARSIFYDSCDVD